MQYHTSVRNLFVHPRRELCVLLLVHKITLTITLHRQDPLSLRLRGRGGGGGRGEGGLWGILTCMGMMPSQENRKLAQLLICTSHSIIRQAPKNTIMSARKRNCTSQSDCQQLTCLDTQVLGSSLHTMYSCYLKHCASLCDWCGVSSQPLLFYPCINGRSGVRV